MTRNAILVRIGQLFEITGQPPVVSVGDVLNYTFGTEGGTAPVTWDCTPNPIGSSGASFSGGTISGTMVNGGIFPFTLTATDANRFVAHATFNLIVLGVSVYFMATETSLITMCTESGVPMVPQ